MAADKSNHLENVLNVKKRFADAVKYGMTNPESFQTILTEILSEVEKYRLQSMAQINNLEKEIRKLYGQAEAFNAMGGVIFNILNNMVSIQEREEENKVRYEQEQEEKRQALEAEQQQQQQEEEQLPVAKQRKSTKKNNE